MAITALSYEAPVRRPSRRIPLDFGHLETAVSLAEEGKPLESLTKVLEHLFPGKAIPDLRKEAFQFTQGSSKVSLRIEGDDVVATVPLIRLPTGGSAIAAMRFVLTKISASGQLYQPRLKGDDVELEFRDRLSRLHPAKIVEVLRRMPDEADDNDDWLVGQFSAHPLDRAPITPVSSDELARCETIWRAHWRDVEELLKECQRKRSMFFLNELTAYAVYRVAFTLPLVGYLGARLDESASFFNDSDEEPMKREAALAKCVKEMKVVTTEELQKSLGHAEYAISPLGEGTPLVLGKNLGAGHYLETIDQHRKSSKAMDAALALISTYTFMLGRFSWAEPIEAELKAGLASASGKPWREAANILFDHAKALVAKYGEEEEEEEDEDEEEDEEGDEDEDGDEEEEDEEEEDA